MHAQDDLGALFEFSTGLPSAQLMPLPYIIVDLHPGIQVPVRLYRISAQ